MITGILISDGPSRRHLWQINKIKGKPILLYSIEAAQNSKLDEVILVIGKEYHQILNHIKINNDRVRIVMNRRYDRGLSSYLRTGMSVMAPESDGVMVIRCEYPFITSGLIDQLIQEFNEKKAQILLPTYKEKDGQPVIVGKNLENSLRRVVGNDIGETIIQKNAPDVVRLDLDNKAVLISVDNVEGLIEEDNRLIKGRKPLKSTQKKDAHIKNKEEESADDTDEEIGKKLLETAELKAISVQPSDMDKTTATREIELTESENSVAEDYAIPEKSKNVRPEDSGQMSLPIEKDEKTRQAEKKELKEPDEVGEKKELKEQKEEPDFLKNRKSIEFEFKNLKSAGKKGRK